MQQYSKVYPLGQAEQGFDKVNPGQAIMIIQFH